jgi:energy-coupling factor transporter ATP-binding protein EcfA2
VKGGFLDGVAIELADGLNCFIGARGTGKTTALEFLRYGLDRLPDPRVDRDRRHEIEKLIAANLDHGSLEISIHTQAGLRYVVRRSSGVAPTVTNEIGESVSIPLDDGRLFAIDIYSQNQIEDMARNPSAQLALIDRFSDERLLEVENELESLRAKLKDLAVQLRKLDDEISAQSGLGSEAAVFRERLKALAPPLGPDAERTDAAHAAQANRIREKQVAPTVLSRFDRLEADLRRLEAEHASPPTVVALDGDNAHVMQSIQDAVDAVSDAVRSASRQIASVVQYARTNIGLQAAQLAERHIIQEETYQALLAELNEVEGRATERRSIQEKLAAAEAAENAERALRDRRGELLNHRGGLLKRCSELRDERFELRDKVAQHLSSTFSLLRVQIIQDGNSDPYQAAIFERLKNERLQRGVQSKRIVEALTPSQLAALVSQGASKELAAAIHCDEAVARRILEALGADGGAYDIEAIELEDRPKIELLDGEVYKEATSLSTGQRCTTILPILLLQSARPLLVDQPEDNLDNAFVYDTIVKALRDAAGARQVIFVTHNPNIPVLGNAGRVFVFDSDGEHGRLRAIGTVDECREEIELVLEGGRKAFLERKERYGH